MYRILICCYEGPDGKIGGPIAWLLDFVRFISAQPDLSICVLSLKPGGIDSRVYDDCCSVGVECVVLNTEVHSSMDAQCHWILQHLIQRKPHVFIANLVLPAMLISGTARQAGIRTIAILHSDPAFDPFYRDVVEYFLLDRNRHNFDVVVSVAQHIDRYIRPSASPELFRRIVIPCGSAFTKTGRVHREDELRLLYVGRIEQKQKRIRETLSALQMACELPGVSATVCGTGSEAGWLKQHLTGNTRMQFIGQVEPHLIPSVMRQHDVIVLLSDFEGHPIAIAEGMMNGLVPICMRGQWSEGIISDGCNGLLIDDRGCGFKDAVQRLLDRPLLRGLSVNAVSTARMSFSHDVVFESWKKLILEESACSGTVNPRRLTLHLADWGDRFQGYPQRKRPLCNRMQRWMAEYLQALILRCRGFGSRMKKQLRQNLRI